MSKLQIAGSVVFSDLTPAAAASVEIWELDLGPGGQNDKILARTTDQFGRFSGLSSEWNDADGRVFGVPIPDILNLEFRVQVDGQNHKGPLILVNGQAAPIVLPFGPRKSVGKAARELVQVICLSDGWSGQERAMYEFIELSSRGIAATLLGPVYNRIQVLQGNDATLAQFQAALSRAAASAGTAAVDVLLNLHGSDQQTIPFKEAEYSVAAMQTALSGIPAPLRRKFRTVFSTACFGETHLGMWTGVGFDVASGSRGIYADSALSFGPMLGRWASEGTFGEAIQLANTVGLPADAAARAFYQAHGPAGNASCVNSRRAIVGHETTRIYSTPVA